MRKWRDMLEKISMAVTHAEVAEHQTVMSLAGIQHRRPAANGMSLKKPSLPSLLPRLTAPIGPSKIWEPAKPSLDDFLQNVGLYGVKARYGLVTVG